MKLLLLLPILTILLPDVSAAQGTYIALSANGDGWEAAFKQATKFVAQMILEEKVNITVSGQGVPRLGFPGVCGPPLKSHTLN